MFVVYQIADTRYAGRKGRYDAPIFDTEGAAKSHLTRLVKAGKFERSALAIADLKTFREQIEKQVVRQNLLSGKDFVESINTPNYLSPSSETYWSM